MNAETPSLQPAIDAVRGFASHAPALSAETQETLREVIRRLERLSAQTEKLIAINNSLLGTSGVSTEFDVSTDCLVIRAGDTEQRLQLRRTDPNVPITMRTLTAGGAYHAGATDDVPLEDAQLRLELESKLEAFYQSAHRVLKLLGTIPDLRKIKCMAITQVRNKLIEHPDDGTIYSFGFGSTGPRVKPMRRGTPAWNDEGLVPNTRDFVDAIAAGFAATRT